MKKIIIILMSVGFVINLSAQNRIKAVVNDPNHKDIGAIIISNKTMWVGLTINPDTRNEMNFKVQKVNAGESHISFDVSKVHKGSNELKRIVTDTETWTNNNVINEGLPYVVALWEKKVNIVQCTINNGKPCKYCRNKGYHLEGRVDRKTARYNPNGKYKVFQ